MAGVEQVATGGYVNYTYGQNLSGQRTLPTHSAPEREGGLRYQPHAATWARLELHTAAKQDRLAKGDQDDNRIPEGGTPGWNVVNAAAGYQIGKVRLSAELQNLFNEAYRTHGSGVFGRGP